MKRLMFISVICALATMPALADITEVTVPGTSCIYFAGRAADEIVVPSGDDYDDYFDADIDEALDDDEVDTMPVWVDITGFGGTISITATGKWGHGPNDDQQSGPNGYAWWDNTHPAYTALGISAMSGVQVNALIGVFLTDNPPSLVVPKSLAWGDDMTTPKLQQAFLIGEKLEDIVIPTDATRLFLGLNNSYEWSNNVGELTVRVVPVPAAVLLGMLGLGAAGIRLRKHV